MGHWDSEQYQCRGARGWSQAKNIHYNQLQRIDEVHAETLKSGPIKVDLLNKDAFCRKRVADRKAIFPLCIHAEMMHFSPDVFTPWHMAMPIVLPFLDPGKRR
jgi:hypothetical protein